MSEAKVKKTKKDRRVTVKLFGVTVLSVKAPRS